MTLPSFFAASISSGVIAVAGGAAARTLAAARERTDRDRGRCL